MPSRILYISYDGMLEPLGQSQVLAYLEKLAPGREIHLISFEKPRDWSDTRHRSAVEGRIARAGIHWHPFRYRNRPRIVAAVYNLIRASLSAVVVAFRHRITIFHARNILCSAMCLPAALLRRGKLISDIRGFWPDERVDARLIPGGGAVYRVLKVIERAALRSSAQIVTLTKASVPILERDPGFGTPKAPICVIPTCVDIDRFRPIGHSAAPFVLGYVGSFGTWYMLEETVALFTAIHRQNPDAQFLIVNRHEHETIHAALLRHSIPPASFEIRSALHTEVPALIGRMSAAACFVRTQFSKISSAPTKFAEYLACGVPVAATAGVGDLAEIVRENRVGIAANRLDRNEVNEIAAELLKLGGDSDIRKRCRAVAEELFSLESGVERYRSIYDRLSA